MKEKETQIGTPLGIPLRYLATGDKKILGPKRAGFWLQFKILKVSSREDIKNKESHIRTLLGIATGDEKIGGSKKADFML